jgi:hypothetical protein
MSEQKKLLRTLCYLLALSVSCVAATERDISWLADYAAMRQFVELGQTASNNDNWPLAAKYYAQASELSGSIPGELGQWMDSYTIQAYAKSGSLDALDRHIGHAANRGYRSAGFIENNADFNKLPKSTEFKSALNLIRNSDKQYQHERLAPEAAKLVFDDVPRFWLAYDLAKQKRSASEKAAIFRQHYLANGSAGLVEYHWIKTQSMERLVKKIEESPGFYEGIRQQTLKAAAYEPQIRDGFDALKMLYPDAYFPDVSFVIGRLNSGGTAGPSGMLIGLDVWSWTEGVPLDGISPGFQKILKSSSLERLPYVVIHEHIHSLQSYTGEVTTLRSAIQEGSADFLTLKALPNAPLPPYFIWGYANEERIWNRFKEEMNGNDSSDWIGNNSTEYDDSWHADLGYFIGAEIAKAYYEQAKDKQQAIKDLLHVNDPGNILAKSEYAERFKK